MSDRPFVQVSFFPPPPPPPIELARILGQMGCDAAFFQVALARWHHKVVASQAAHPDVPPCPAPREGYVFEEPWLLAASRWWWTFHHSRKIQQPSTTLLLLGEAVT